MIGGIIGDVLGSVYEAYQWKHKNQPLIITNPVSEMTDVIPLFKDLKWVRRTQYWTDDTLCTLGLYNAYINNLNPSTGLADFCNKYKNQSTGFGKNFEEWLNNPESTGNSYGNGAIMRLGFIPNLNITLPEKLKLAQAYTRITHNHTDSLTAVKDLILIAEVLKLTKDKKYILDYLEAYNIQETVESYHTQFKFELNVQKTLHQVMVILNESTSFEDVMRNCFYVGGDSDTLACIAGNLAALLYEIPDYLIQFTMKCFITESELLNLIDHFNKHKI